MISGMSPSKKACISPMIGDDRQSDNAFQTGNTASEDETLPSAPFKIHPQHVRRLDESAGYPLDWSKKQLDQPTFSANNISGVPSTNQSPSKSAKNPAQGIYDHVLDLIYGILNSEMKITDVGKNGLYAQAERIRILKVIATKCNNLASKLNDRMKDKMMESKRQEVSINQDYICEKKSQSMKPLEKMLACYSAGSHSTFTDNPKGTILETLRSEKVATDISKLKIFLKEKEKMKESKRQEVSIKQEYPDEKYTHCMKPFDTIMGGSLSTFADNSTQNNSGVIPNHIKGIISETMNSEKRDTDISQQMILKKKEEMKESKRQVIRIKQEHPNAKHTQCIEPLDTRMHGFPSTFPDYCTGGLFGVIPNHFKDIISETISSKKDTLAMNQLEIFSRMKDSKGQEVSIKQEYPNEINKQCMKPLETIIDRLPSTFVNNSAQNISDVIPDRIRGIISETTSSEKNALDISKLEIFFNKAKNKTNTRNIAKSLRIPISHLKKQLKEIKMRYDRHPKRGNKEEHNFMKRIERIIISLD